MITLSPSQQDVVDSFPLFLMNDEKEMIISGFAGSGKSFLVKYLADMGEKQQKLVKILDPNIPRRKLFFTATTNKAAAVLKDMIHRPVCTIHSLLGLKVVNNYKTGKQQLSQKTKVADLRHSIVFIDESSMINEELLMMIRKAVSRFIDCKVVFIGDEYQLPPVMEDICPVFKSKNNVFFLKEIQRQVADSPIIQLSAQYRAVLDDHTKNWPEIPHDGQNIIHHTNKVPFFAEIKKCYLQTHAADDYKVIAWSNNRVRLYNEWIRKLQGATLPFHVGETMISNKPLIDGDDAVLAPTDSMQFIKGVTDDTVDGIRGYQIELYGHIKTFFQPASWVEANKLSKQYAKDKLWPNYFEITQNWIDLRPIHASTVHKAQGSTYNTVFIDLNNIGANTRWREVARLVYVAITRASNTVHVYGDLCLNYNKKPPVNLLESFNANCL